MKINLEPEESIELILKKKKYLPLRNADWIKIPMFLISPFLIFTLLLEFKIENIKEGFGLFTISFVMVYLYFFLKVINNYYKRYLVAFKWKYVLTNERLIIIKHKNLIEKFFYYNDFPNFECEENAYGNGCLIIGEKEPFFAESYSPTNYNVGINYSEEDFILYNIENIKNIYNILKTKVEINNKKVMTESIK